MTNADRADRFVARIQADASLASKVAIDRIGNRLLFHSAHADVLDRIAEIAEGLRGPIEPHQRTVTPQGPYTSAAQGRLTVRW